MSLFVPADDQRYQKSIDLPSSSGPTSGFIENVVKEGKYAWKTRTSTAEHTLKGLALERSKDEFNKLVDKGIIDQPKLENPALTGRARDNPEFESSLEGFGELTGFATTFVPGALGFDTLGEESLKEFTESLRKANEKLGRQKFELTTPEDVQKALEEEIQQSKEDIEQFRDRSKTTSGTIGSFAGPIITETVGDPIDAASLAFGASASSGIMKTAAIEGVIGGTTEAAQQPFVQEYRNKVGLEAGPKQALSNIAMVAVGSAGLGGGIRGLIDGGDEIAKRFGLRRPGYEQAGKEIAENLEQFPDSVKESFMEGTATRDDMAEILNFEMNRGNLDPQQKAVLEIHEANKILRTSNPYDNGSVPKIERGRLEHIENLTRAQRAVQEGKTPDIDPAENPTPLRMQRVEPNLKQVDPDQIDFEDQPLPVETERSLEGEDIGENIGTSPVLFRKGSGQFSVLRGREQIATGRPGESVNAVVIDGRKNDINDARAWIMGRDAELNNVSKADVSEATGRSEESLPDLSQSQWTRDMKSLMKLDDRAFREMAGQRVPTNIAREVAERVEDPEAQRRAMRVLGSFTRGDVQSPGGLSIEGEPEAIEVIEQGIKNGFTEEQATSVIETMNTIRNSAIEELRRGNRTLTINGDDVNVDGGFAKGLRQLSRSRTPIGRSLRNAARETTDGSSTRSGVDEFVRQVTREIEQGNVSRADIRETGAFQQSQEEVQQIITRNTEDARELAESVRNGESDELDELETTVREKFGEKDTVEIEETDADGNTVQRELTVGERLDEINNQQEQVNALRECLI